MSAHEDLRRRIEGRGSSDRSFGLVFAAFFFLLAVWPVLSSRPPRLWATALSAGLLLVTLVRPSILHPANLVWMRIGLLLNKITNPLITGVLFYLLFVPVGLLLRLLKKDPLRLRYDPEASTYWIARCPPGPSPDTMSKQF